MQATLLIRNLSKIYTCSPAGTVIQNGFIACFHDRILAVGKGDGSKYIEKDLTRILDGTGCIAVPGFIEPFYHGSFDMEYKLRQDLTRRFYNGILTFVTEDPALARQDLCWRVYGRRQAASQSLYRLSRGDYEKGQLLTSLHDEYSLYSLQPLLWQIMQTKRIPETELIRMITSLPAQALDLKDDGQIKKGMHANLLLIYGKSFQDYINTMGACPIEWIIHQGIPVWPQVIRC